MSPRRFTLLTVSLALVAFHASRSHAAWPHHSMINLPVVTVTNAQYEPAMVSDGAGGAIVTWYDLRDGAQYDIYAQHILASGAVDAAWPSQGRAVTSGDGFLSQYTPKAVTDGAGGAFIAWFDGLYDVRVHHVLASGALDAAWPFGGRAVAAVASLQLSHDAVADGAGGVLVTWRDNRNGNDDIFAQHVLASGALDPAWPATGVALTTAAGDQDFPRIASDGAVGAIVTWEDRAGPDWNIYAQRALSNGTNHPLWPANGLAVCTATGLQNRAQIVPDGAAGAVIVWEDQRTDSDIYAMRVQASGGPDPAWPSNGLLVCQGPMFSIQGSPTLVTDGAGGAIVTWHDRRSAFYDIYAHHVFMTGVLDPTWPVDGRDLCTAGTDQSLPTIASDGAGGAIVAWRDARNGAWDIYAQRVAATGAVDPTWPVNGRALTNAPGNQWGPAAIVIDGLGGAISAWADERTGQYDVYAQRVARHGYLGTPEGEIVSVRDVPNDEGGKVKVSWNASYLDTGNDPNLAYYEIYRSVPPNLATALIERRERPVLSLAESKGGTESSLFTTTEGAATYYWEFVGSQSAIHFLPGYSFLATTTGDSTGAYNPATAFMTVARDLTGSYYWLSYPMSGYSVDNLPPGTPEPFAGNYAAGATHLHWNPNSEPDLAHYRLYRGSSAGFVPGPGNLLASPPDTGWADASAAGGYYKLSAVDIHGNESGYALLSPGATTHVAAGPPGGTLSLSPPSPNPAHRLAGLTFTLTRAGEVRLRVYDARGRTVRTLAGGPRAAGAHRVEWDLRDGSDRQVQSGLYFVELEAEGRRTTKRLAVTR